MKLLSLALSLPLLVQVALSGTFTFQNNCPYTVWPATFASTAQLLQTGFELRPDHFPGTAQLLQTGFELPTGGSLNLDFYDTRNSDTLRPVACSGAGAPPATRAEFALSGSANTLDFYDTRNSDGFNVPISISPVGGLGDIKDDCTTTSCAADINSICPNQLQDKAADGTVVGCNSACEVFGSPEYCCKGSFGTRQTCSPTNYSQIFKTACPTTYSYPYGDAASAFTCTGASYVITFCP